MPETRSFNVAISPPPDYNLRHAIARRTDRAVAAHPGGSHARPATRNLSLSATHPDVGGAAHRPVSTEQGDRRLVPLPGSGGRVGRVGVRPVPGTQSGHPV